MKQNKQKTLSRTQKLNIKYLTSFIKNNSDNFDGSLDSNAVIKDIIKHPKG